MSPRKAGTPRPSRAKRAAGASSALVLVDELVTVDPSMNGAPLGFENIPAPARDPAPAAPELAAAAALGGEQLDDGAGDVAGAAPWTGAQLIDAAEGASAAVVLMAAERAHVPAAQAAELERLSMLTRMERQLLALVADDAAQVVGTRGHMPPKLAAGLFFAGVVWIGFSRLRAVAALAPAKLAEAEAKHRDRWGNASDAVPVGVNPERAGFPAPFPGASSPAA